MGVVRRVLSQPAIGRPNGLAITPDDKTLYVIDSHSVAGGNRKIWAFDVERLDGTLANQRLVFDFGRGRGGDGMRLDRAGNLWVAAGVLKPRHAHETGDVKTGIHVISPDGKLLGRIPIPEDVLTNLTFGGADFKTLFVTSGKTVFRLSNATCPAIHCIRRWPIIERPRTHGDASPNTSTLRHDRLRCHRCFRLLNRSGHMSRLVLACRDDDCCASAAAAQAQRAVHCRRRFEYGAGLLRRSAGQVAQHRSPGRARRAV